MSLIVVQHRAVLCPHSFQCTCGCGGAEMVGRCHDNMTIANTGLQGDDVGRLASLFYADNGAIGSNDHEWLQNVTQHLCNLFRDCTVLKPNTEKTETMSCQPGASRRRCSMEGYKRRHEGIRETYSKKKGKRTVCPFPSCGKDLELGSL